MPPFLQAQKEIRILIVWNDTEVPLAYLISFRTANTWLHGDERGSIDRFHNSYGSPYIPSNKRWLLYNRKQLRTDPLILAGRQRGTISDADSVLVAFKANATRELREQGLWCQPFSPWARKGSRRNLWNERSVATAIDYVLNGQGNDLPDFDD